MGLNIELMAPSQEAIDRWKGQKSGHGPVTLRWSTMPPAPNSGLYLNADDPVAGVLRILKFTIGDVFDGNCSPYRGKIGPWWAGPIEIGAPEGNLGAETEAMK